MVFPDSPLIEYPDYRSSFMFLESCFQLDIIVSDINLELYFYCYLLGCWLCKIYWWITWGDPLHTSSLLHYCGHHNPAFLLLFGIDFEIIVLSEIA